MSVSVQCPTCAKVLLAANDLVGKLASCPQCQTQFPVTTSAARSSGDSSTPADAIPAARPASPDAIPMAKPLNLRTAPSILQASGDVPKPPPNATPTPPPPSSPSSASLAGRPSAAGAHTGTAEVGSTRAKPATAAGQSNARQVTPPAPDPANFYPPGQSPQHRPPAVTAVPPAARGASPSATPSKVSRSTSARPARQAQPARFIPADASATRVELGHDGQLPVLHLEEATRSAGDQQHAQASNPWLLVAALIFSFGMSAVLLFVDLDRAPPEQATKRSARAAIETYYSAPATQPQLYRKLLREALQAYNKRDYATERRRYKQVLDLLHAENKDPLSGLTGQVNALKPPHDRHLEELLSTLVDD